MNSLSTRVLSWGMGDSTSSPCSGCIEKTQSLEYWVFWTWCHSLPPSSPTCCNISYTDVGIFHHFDQRLLPRIGLLKRNNAKKFFISINRAFSIEHTRSRLLINLSLFSLHLPLYPSWHSHLFACCKEISILRSLHKYETCTELSPFLKNKTGIPQFLQRFFMSQDLQDIWIFSWLFSFIQILTENLKITLNCIAKSKLHEWMRLVCAFSYWPVAKNWKFCE